MHPVGAVCFKAMRRMIFLKALEAEAGAEGLVLAETQDIALERTQEEKTAHG